MLEGSDWLREGDQRTPIGPGDVIFVPPGEQDEPLVGPEGMTCVGCHGRRARKL